MADHLTRLQRAEITIRSMQSQMERLRQEVSAERARALDAWHEAERLRHELAQLREEQQ